MSSAKTMSILSRGRWVKDQYSRVLLPLGCTIWAAAEYAEISCLLSKYGEGTCVCFGTQTPSCVKSCITAASTTPILTEQTPWEINADFGLFLSGLRIYEKLIASWEQWGNWPVKWRWKTRTRYAKHVEKFCPHFRVVWSPLNVSSLGKRIL